MGRVGVKWVCDCYDSNPTQPTNLLKLTQLDKLGWIKSVLTDWWIGCTPLILFSLLLLLFLFLFFFFFFFFLQIVRGRFGAVLPNWLFGVLLLFGLRNFTVSAFASSLAIMEITLYFTLRLDAHVESALTSNLVGSKADIRFVSSSSRVHR